MNYRDLPQVYKKILDRENILDMYEASTDDHAFVDEPGFNLDDNQSAYWFVYSLIEDQIRPILEAMDLDGPDDYIINGDIQYSSDGGYKLDIQLTGNFSFCIYGCDKYGSKAHSKVAKALTNTKFNGFTLSEIHKGYADDYYEEDSDTMYIRGDFEFDEYTVDVAVPNNIEYRIWVGIRDFYAEAVVDAPYGLDKDEDMLTSYLKENKPDFLMSFFTLKNVEVAEAEDVDDDEILYYVDLMFDGNNKHIVTYDFSDYLNHPDSPKNIHGKENAINKAFELALDDVTIAYRYY